MNKIKVIADDKIPFLKNILEPYSNILYLPYSRITKQTVNNADALLVRTRTKCNAELLEDTSVKYIATATIGFDHIDTNFCEQNSIKWNNAPGCNSTSVQQYIAAALVYYAHQKKKQLDTLTIGIVGVGNVGSKIQEISKILGLRVLLNDPPRERVEGSYAFVSLDQIIDESDIITFHVPLSLNGLDKTFHLADIEFFNKFNNSKIIINTSRGEVVDTAAMITAVNNRKISFSVLDVWENEPRIDTKLINLVNIATPHIAGYSTEGKANATAVCVNALNEFFNLGLSQNWYPADLPIPNNPRILKVDCAGKFTQDILYELILSTYDILQDNQQLRDGMNDFEKLRGEYAVRREFGFYSVQLMNSSKSIDNLVRELGFKLLQSLS